jgi:hypothetical protein
MSDEKIRVCLSQRDCPERSSELPSEALLRDEPTIPSVLFSEPSCEVFSVFLAALR